MSESNKMRTSDDINSSDNQQTILCAGGTGTFPVTLENARGIENYGGTDGYIAFKRTKSSETELSYFGAGQMKVIKVAECYGTDASTTVNARIWA